MSTALKGKIERSLSYPKTLDGDDEVTAEQSGDPHPGHRYFTPQPARKKPNLPPKPGTITPTPRRRMSDFAVSFAIKEPGVESERLNGPSKEEADDTKTYGSEDRENEAIPNGHAVEYDGMEERNKRPRLAALRAASTLQPLTPRRKAPRKPPLARRRTSDTQLEVIEQLKRRNEAAKSKGASTLRRGTKVARSSSSASHRSLTPDADRFLTSRPQFFTPQPTRRKFNLVDRTPSFNDASPVGPVARLAMKSKRNSPLHSTDSGNSADQSPSPSPHTPVSPLVGPVFKPKKTASRTSSADSLDSSPSPNIPTPSSQLPTSALKAKKMASQSSSDSGLTSDLSSSPSPHTPVSPLAAPAFSGRGRQSARPAPSVPSDWQLSKIDFHQWKDPDKEKQWTRPERSNAGPKDALSRNRAVSMPNKVRRVSGGSVNKSKQRQSTVKQSTARQLASTAGLPSSPAITRSNSGRQRHRSAPAGRVAQALQHDPMFSVSSPTTLVPPTSPFTGGVRRRRASDSLRKEVLRSVSMERSRKLSLMNDTDTKMEKEELTLLGKADSDVKDRMIKRKSGEDQTDYSSQSPNGGTKMPIRRFVSGETGSVYSDYPSTFTSSPGGSPTRQRPRLRRGRSSRTSLGSLKSMLASNEFLNDIFLSDRKSHRKLKGIVGALTGLVLGGFLFLGVHYGLEYSLIASIIISATGTVIMCLGLALTVRARCVAALMVPTLCTSRGRAAFLALTVTLLLTGPIDNVYINAKVASDSMSCSAELAQNQTKLIRDVAREIFDVYVRNLMESVYKLQKASAAVQETFEPVEEALSVFVDTLGNAGEALRAAANLCAEIIEAAHKDCTKGVNDAYRSCKKSLAGIPEIGNAQIDDICELINIGNKVCSLLKTSDGICQAPSLLDDLINKALRATEAALEDLRRLFDTDVNFDSYWNSRYNQSQSVESIQAAIQQELEESISFLNTAFTVVDKIVALSIVYLLFRSYQYHSKYRTKDRFDNFYVTNEFKRLDEKRRENGKVALLPLKKSERRRLIDLSSFFLSKPEKGLFKLGLVTVLLHAAIAALLILADYGLYSLLRLISRHGKVQFEISGGGGSDLTIGGTGVLSQLIQSLFVEGFVAASEFNISLDTSHCLPDPVPPNAAKSVGIGILYLVALLTVLSQAYALRLRRRIAAYFYPERELERINFLYTNTLHKRQSLFKLLKQRIRQTKHEQDVERRVSFVAYLSAKYPSWKRVFRFLGMEKQVCLGCGDLENESFKACGNPDCSGIYCPECLHEIEYTCTLCRELVVGSDLSIGVVEHRV